MGRGEEVSTNPIARGPAKRVTTAHEDSIEGRIRAVKQQTVAESSAQPSDSPALKPANGFNLTLAERNTPALFGTGRIDAIPSEVLIAMAESQPADVRGRVSRTGEGRIGRFGWKAQIASLHEFVRGACANEIGLEVPGFSQAISPLDPDKKAKGLDMTESECDALVAYVRALPAPVVVDPYGPQGTRDIGEGRRLFADIGCAHCHTPTLGDVQGIYSDLLLHDMGQSLSDSGSYYGIDGPDITRRSRLPESGARRRSGDTAIPAPTCTTVGHRTWKRRSRSMRDKARLRRMRFFALSPRERSQVEAFLKSLVAPSAAGTPGVVVANQRETRIKPSEPLVSEVLARQQEATGTGPRPRAVARVPAATEGRSGRQAHQSGHQACRSRRQAKQGQARTRSGS